jgi:hypothetical protein
VMSIAQTWFGRVIAMPRSSRKAYLDVSCSILLRRQLGAGATPFRALRIRTQS